MRVRGVHFNVVDRGGEADRLPFVWGHPLTSCIAAEDRHGVFDWSAVADVDGRRWVRFDARGHGESAGTRNPADYRWANLAHDWLELLDGLGIDRVVLGGASMGSATALHAAAFQPERVAALVLVIPPSAWDTRGPQAHRYRNGARAAHTLGVHAFARMTHKLPDPPIFTEHLSPLSRGGLGAFDTFERRTLAAALKGAAGSDLPSPTELDRVRDIPALVLAWDTDPAHPVTTAHALAGALPHSDLHVATAPADVAAWPALVREFLADCE